MKKLALIMLFLSPLGYAQSDSGITFRDLQWGVSAASIGGLTKIEESGKFTCHVKTEDKLSVGEAALRRIRYCFYDDKFGYVMIDYSGQRNQIVLKDVLDKKFGTPFRPNRFMENYWWNLGKEVAIFMEYNEIGDKGTIVYRYKPVTDIQARDGNASNRKAADDL